MSNSDSGNHTKIPTWVGNHLVAFDKLEAHRRGLLHKAVSVFVLCGDDVLIQRRAMGKYHTPGLWANSCCTHPHWEETPEDCAHRRMQEELGISGLTLEYRDQVSYHADVGGGLIENEQVDIFVARIEARIECELNPDEVMDISWVNLAELNRKIAQTPEKFTPWLRIYMDEFAQAIFGTASA